MSFEIKPFLDRHVVPLLGGQASIVSFLWKEDMVLVFLEVPAANWPSYVKALLDGGKHTFDYLRGPEPAVVGGQRLVLFGGDGAPFITNKGRVVCRLHHRPDGERDLVLEVATPLGRPGLGPDVVKAFFAQWEGEPSPLTRFRPEWGLPGIEPNELAGEPQGE